MSERRDLPPAAAPDAGAPQERTGTMNDEGIVIGLNTCIHHFREGRGYCDACLAVQKAQAEGKCVNCKERPATLDWVGDGGVLAYTHGMSVRWCEVCALRAQLEHAKAAAQRIPELEAKLAPAAHQERTEPLCEWFSARKAIETGIDACFVIAGECERSARGTSDGRMLLSAENHRIAARVMQAFLRQNLHDPNCSRIGKPCECQFQIDPGDVAVPARAHQEEKEDEMPDDLARSGTPEIRDRQPAAVTDAGEQDDCAGGVTMDDVNRINHWLNTCADRATSVEERLSIGRLMNKVHILWERGSYGVRKRN